jgi:hypothetical protein
MEGSEFIPILKVHCESYKVKVIKTKRIADLSLYSANSYNSFHNGVSRNWKKLTPRGTMAYVTEDLAAGLSSGVYNWMLMVIWWTLCGMSNVRDTHMLTPLFSAVGTWTHAGSYWPWKGTLVTNRWCGLEASPFCGDTLFYYSFSWETYSLFRCSVFRFSLSITYSGVFFSSFF